MRQLVAGRTRCTIHVYACRVPPQPPPDHAPPDNSQVSSGHLGLLRSAALQGLSLGRCVLWNTVPCLYGCVGLRHSEYVWWSGKGSLPGSDGVRQSCTEGDVPCHGAFGSIMDASIWTS
jgi:hypothetical protein